MKKYLLLMLIILLIPVCLFSAEEESKLALVLSADTFKIGFRDENGKALSEPSFSLNKTNLSYANVDQTAKTDDDSNIYYSATVTFRVWWEALVSTGEKGVTIKLTASSYLEGTTSSDRLYAVGTDKIDVSNYSDVTLLEPKASSKDTPITSDVETIYSDKIYAGSKNYIIGYDLRNAKSGVTYTGTVSLKVEVNA